MRACGFVSMNVTTNLEINAINKFILYNTKETWPWVAFYELKRRKWDIDIKEFKQLHGRSMHFLNHLQENMPMNYLNILGVDQAK